MQNRQEVDDSLRDIDFCPQIGMQEQVLLADASFIVYGGSRGGGKSFALMLDILYDTHNPKFTANVFRRNLKDLTKGGGLFDKAKLIYPALGGRAKPSALQFEFPSGAMVTFDHLENESDSVIESRFKGLEIPAIYIDEIDQIKFNTVMKLIQSNRNSLGIRNRLHGSCNPNSQSWLRKWISYYVNNEGYIDPEKDGQVRYFYVYGSTVDDVYWGNTKEEVYQQAKSFIDMAWNPEFADRYGMSKHDMIKSFVFIKGDLAENAKLIENDPSYIANISMGGKTEISRNFMGNWDQKDDGEEMIPRSVMEAMFDNSEQRTGRKRLAIDVALLGADSCVFIVADGLHLIDIEIHPFLRPDDLKALVKRMMDKHNIRPDDLFYDGVGNGQVLNDFTRAYAVQPNAKPLNDDESFDKLKSQIMWQLGSLLLDTKISIDEALSYKRFDYGKKGMMTVREILQHERRALKIDESDGKTKMLGKKGMKAILGHSPDFLEALVYLIIHTLIKNKGKSKKRGLNYLR